MYRHGKRMYRHGNCPVYFLKGVVFSLARIGTPLWFLFKTLPQVA